MALRSALVVASILVAGYAEAAPPPPPLLRAFRTITLPGVHGAVVAVAGRSARDLWFLTDEAVINPPSEQGVLVHFDGRRVVEQVRPPCFQGIFTSVELDRGGVLLPGLAPAAAAWMTAYRPYGGRTWSCTIAWYGGGGAPNGSFSRAGIAPGEPAWALECVVPYGGPCRFRGAGGRRAPYPTHQGALRGELAVSVPAATLWQLRGEDAGWMVLDDEDGHPTLDRFNGVAWAHAAPLGDLAPTAMWVDDEGHPWLLAPGALVRYDGKGLDKLAVPEGFAATIITGSSAGDVWLFGPGRAAWQWDGKHLHRGEAPFEVGGAWAAPDGAVWVVGRFDWQQVAGTTPPGVVARTESFAEEQR